MFDEAKHRCGVRYLCNIRHKKGLTWFRNYIATYHFDKVLLDDFFTQYKLGNRGEWGCWKNTLSEQQGLGI